jgi:hypothetical protein
MDGKKSKSIGSSATGAFLWLQCLPAADLFAPDREADGFLFSVPASIS